MSRGMVAFAEAVGSGALPNLKKLFLFRNQIGDTGMLAFARAITPTPQNRMGGLPALLYVALSGNPGGPAPVDEALVARKK